MCLLFLVALSFATYVMLPGAFPDRLSYRDFSWLTMAGWGLGCVCFFVAANVLYWVGAIFEAVLHPMRIAMYRRSTFFVQLCCAATVPVGIAGCDMVRVCLTDPLVFVTDLTPVQVFDRKALFLAKDSHIWLLNSTLPGHPERKLRVPGFGDANCEIAVSQNGLHVYFADSASIWKWTYDDDPIQVCKPRELSNQPSAAFVVGLLRICQSEQHIYFQTVMLDASWSVCQYDMVKKTLKMIGTASAHGVDVNADTGVVYWVDKTDVRVRSFDGNTSDRYLLSHPYSRCQLSSDGTKILLSTTHYEGNSEMSILDLSTRTETVLPAAGSDAVWGGKDSVFYLNGENALWEYVISAKLARQIISCPGETTGPERSFGMRPVLSADNGWICWRWAIQGPFGLPRLGTVLIDRESSSYRQLRGWWHNVQWAD